MAKCLYPKCNKDVIPPKRRYCSDEHGKKYRKLTERDESSQENRLKPEKKYLRCLKCNRLFYTDKYHRICKRHKDDNSFEKREYSLSDKLRASESKTLEDID